MNPISEGLRQVIEGEDYPAPKSVISRVKACDAVCVPPGFMYSLATLVEHTDLWNRAWLARILGEPSVNVRKDWMIPSERQWPEVRERFLATLDRAYVVASAEPFVHCMETEEMALFRVNRIATHTAYHLGQFVLVKRAVRSFRKAGDDND